MTTAQITENTKTGHYGWALIEIILLGATLYASILAVKTNRALLQKLNDEGYPKK